VRARYADAIIVDKSALFRAGLARVLTNTRFRLKVAVEYVAAIPEAAFRSKTSVILLIGVDGCNETDLSNISLSKKNFPLLNVVALGKKFDTGAICTALEAGADGYLLKDEITTEALLKALEVILLGEAVLPRQFTQLLRADNGMSLPSKADTIRLVSVEPRVEYKGEVDIERQHPALPPLERLSEREQMILDHIARGSTNKHIARDLNVAEATVKVHVKAILRKAKVRNRTQAAIWAVNSLRLPEATISVDALPLVDSVEGFLR
jgi:two-component system, NarL family, nitrate/nitrite response regulator NarL